MAGMPQHRAGRNAPLRQIKLRIPNAEWQAMSEIDRIKAAFGMSLDDVHKLMSIPYEEADLHERNLKLQVFITLMKTGLQLFKERERDSFRQQVLKNLGVLIKEQDGE